jgi:DNA-binding transcriptional ArsR family regulator
MNLTSSDMDLELDQQGFEKALALVKAMDNRHRLMILCMLCEGERTVTEMSRATGLSLSAVSQHLSILKDKDLVDWTKRSQVVTYRLKTGDVQQVISLFKDLFCRRGTV